MMDLMKRIQLLAHFLPKTLYRNGKKLDFTENDILTINLPSKTIFDDTGGFSQFCSTVYARLTFCALVCSYGESFC